MTLPLFKHQEAMANFALANARVFNTSDPGTGKTRGTLEGLVRRRDAGMAQRCLVVAPLSILEAAWGDDIRQFTNLTYAVAHGTPEKREKAFLSNADIVLINHDGVKLIAKQLGWLEGFTDLVIDESTAFKNRTAQRSKAMFKVAQRFEHITLLTGSPSPNTVQDVWHQAYILDHGKRLGNRFFQFRSQVCTPEQIGPRPEHVKWVDKPGAETEIADALHDITIRFQLEDCIDMPEHIVHHMQVDMPKVVIKAYLELENEASLTTPSGTVTAIHAGAKVKKMLQVLSGAVYDSAGNIHPVHNARYDLVMQLVSERAHSLVAFNWAHERAALTEAATKMGISYGVIDGSVKPADRQKVVDDFQKGKLQVVFCQPQSAGHGLTLTRGTSTIWCSPTYNLEHFVQFNRRVYRAGQKKKTEVICIAARGTKEIEVYEKLQGKDAHMTDLLNIFTRQTEAA